MIVNDPALANALGVVRRTEGNLPTGYGALPGSGLKF